MEIKPIPNDDFMELATLMVEFYQSIDKNINQFQAVNTLIHFINNTEGFLALGLYDENVLVGFTCGNKLTETIFYFSCMYVIIKNSEWTKKLIDASFDKIKELGYTAWEADASNENMSSILEKYNAIVKYKRYYKEL